MPLPAIFQPSWRRLGALLGLAAGAATMAQVPLVEEAVEPQVAVGERADIADGVQFSVLSAESVSSAPDYMGVQRPGNYLRVDFEVANDGQRPFLVSATDIGVATDRGTVLSEPGSAEFAERVFLSAEVDAGSASSGTLYFHASGSSDFDQVRFAPSALDGRSVAVRLI